MSRKPQVLLLSLSIVAALAACKPGEKAAGDVAAPGEGAAPKLTLDESKLPRRQRFQAADLDTSKNACTDFDGYVNSKWLAANPIPGDRTSWGAFEMLDERSTAVQRQLAEQAAADANATGVEKIVGDFWATGMDEAKINAQGIKPIEVAPGRDRRADRRRVDRRLPAHSARQGRGHAVRLRPRGRLQGFRR